MVGMVYSDLGILSLNPNSYPYPHNGMMIDLNTTLTTNEEDQDQEYCNKKSKLCARGHWRPAEDAKLKELVALYGPQNWNLIAENLQGRSGKY